MQDRRTRLKSPHTPLTLKAIAMNRQTRFCSPSAVKSIALALSAVCAALCALPALANKDDRTQPINLSFERHGTTDRAKGRTEIVGDVMLSQGSTLLRAERADLRETPDGFYRASASGTLSKQVSFRQGGDATGEAVQGSADRLDYDSRAYTVRLQGRARMQHVEGARVAMEVTGASVAYDKRANFFTIEGGSGSPNPKGRGRILLMPTPANNSDAADGIAPALELQPSLTLTQPN